MKNNIFGYKFNNIALLQEALTHPSTNASANYQKLEFLGDRILNFIIAEYLYHHFSDEKEGDLAKRHIASVCGETIAKIAKEEQLGKMIIVSHGEKEGGGCNNNSNLEDIMESLLAAIYLDSDDIILVRKIILKLWKKYLNNSSLPPQDPKSQLQELIQKNGLPLPKYTLIKKEGSPHKPVFTMKIKVHGYKEISTIASNKKKAEKKLAELMLKAISHKL